MTIADYLALALFVVTIVSLMAGYPVAFTLAGSALFMAGIGWLLGVFDLSLLGAIPSRILGVAMWNETLLAVPLFIFMGIMLEKSGLAESLLETMAMLFGKTPGGLAISVVIVGALLAASTGIVGATVITMGLISLPTMLKRGYKPELATGTIASAGTLGQIIPPSVVLVLLGSVLSVSVGDLFKAALLPGVLLVVAYITYILLFALRNPNEAPSIPKEEIEAKEEKIQKAVGILEQMKEKVKIEKEKINKLTEIIG